MKILKFIFGLVRAIIFICITLIVGIILIQRVFNNKVSIGGFRLFTIVTQSMVPVYNVSDVIISKAVPVDELKVDDDVVYLGNKGDFKDRIVTHRIVNIDKTSESYVITTKGVANTAEDPTIEYSQIYGKVVYKSVILSLISRIVNNPVGFYVLIIVPVVILISLEFVDKFREKLEQQEQDEAVRNEIDNRSVENELEIVKLNENKNNKEVLEVVDFNEK